MFQYSILSSPSFLYDEKIIEKIFSEVWTSLDIPQNGTLNIVFVSDEEIQNLNKTYREKDAVTDVLSFHYFEDFSELQKDDVAGELIFCESKIFSQAKEYWLGEEKEFYKLLIHSILHILWYDHEDDDEYQEMQEKEDIIAINIFWEKLS